MVHRFRKEITLKGEENTAIEINGFGIKLNELNNGKLDLLMVILYSN